MNIESIENGVKITIPKKENYTLEDLKQNLVNYLNKYIGKLYGFEKEIELLKVILDYENKD